MAFVAVAVVGGASQSCDNNAQQREKARRQQEQQTQLELRNQILEQKAREVKASQDRKNSEFTAQVNSFSEKHLPELQSALQRLSEQIGIRRQSLAAWTADLEAAGRSAAADDRVKRWQEEIERLDSIRKELSTQRVDTYLAFRATELDPESPEARRALESSIAIARRETAKVLENLKNP